MDEYRLFFNMEPEYYIGNSTSLVFYGALLECFHFSHSIHVFIHTTEIEILTAASCIKQKNFSILHSLFMLAFYVCLVINH